MGSERESRNYSSGMMAGVPVIRGTRVPLWTLVTYLEDGRGLAGFLADHPQVTPAQADRAIIMGLQALVDLREDALGRPRPATGGEPPTPPRPQDSKPE